MKIDNIPWLEGYYISKRGVLWSRYAKCGALTKNLWHKVIPNKNQRGYLFVQKKGRSDYIHRLVAQIYIPNPENKPYVCHKDNNPQNNHVDNLYWGTHQENMAQRERDGRGPQGIRNPMYGRIRTDIPSKLSPEQKQKVLQLRSQGIKLQDIANMFGVAKITIRRAINPKSKASYYTKLRRGLESTTHQK